jgi:hypothetical protein
LKLKDEGIKIDEIKMCVIYECQWNTYIGSVVRTMIALANCVMRKMFETRKGAAECYVTRIAC